MYSHNSDIYKPNPSQHFQLIPNLLFLPHPTPLPLPRFLTLLYSPIKFF